VSTKLYLRHKRDDTFVVILELTGSSSGTTFRWKELSRKGGKPLLPDDSGEGVIDSKKHSCEFRLRKGVTGKVVAVRIKLDPLSTISLGDLKNSISTIVEFVAPRAGLSFPAGGWTWQIEL